MLDTDTKRRIDTARDILVGKVPDPKSQVEQITIALIYKFMDDMDAGNLEALKQDVIVSTDIDDGNLREPTEHELRILLAEHFQRGRILDQRIREGRSRDYYYLVYREPDGRVYALVATDMYGRFRIVIPESPMSRRHRYLWDYTWTN